MFDIKRAHQLEAVAELAKNVKLPIAELEALKEMHKMKEGLRIKLNSTSSEPEAS